MWTDCDIYRSNNGIVKRGKEIVCRGFESIVYV